VVQTLIYTVTYIDPCPTAVYTRTAFTHTLTYYLRYVEESFYIPRIESPENDYLCGVMVYSNVYSDGSPVDDNIFTWEEFDASQLTFKIFTEDPIDESQSPIYSQTYDI